jgi:hypothetical protein
MMGKGKNAGKGLDMAKSKVPAAAAKGMDKAAAKKPAYAKGGMVTKPKAVKAGASYKGGK